MSSKPTCITLFTVLSTILLCQGLYAQQVIDAITGEPVPFANIQVVGSESRGTSAAEDGTFTLNVEDSTQIRVSSVGFKPLNALYVGPSTLILLERVSSELQEVVIVPDESEAARVIRLCVENRSHTAPSEYDYFQCILYNKYRADLLTDSSGNLSRLQRMLESQLEGQSIFFSESAMTYAYEKPGKTKEVIIANRVVGFETPEFNMLPEQFIPLDLNKDFLDLFNRDYLSPLSKGSEHSYVLHLEETRVEGVDTSWYILFWPQKSQYDLLRGSMVISSDQYALEELRISNDKRDAIQFDIYHHFRKWQGRWFPDQLFSNIILSDAGFDIDVLYDQKTYIDSVRFEKIPIAKKDVNRISFDRTIMDKPERILSYRSEPLSPDDSVAIHSVAVTSERMHIERKTDLISNISFGRVPLGIVDIDLYRTLYGNASEGWRLGTGLITNKHFSRLFSLDGYYGWGIRDHVSKYGGGISFNLNPEETIKAYARYDRDVLAVSSFQVTDISTSLVAGYYSQEFEDVVSYGAGLKGRLSNWVYHGFFQHRETDPRFAYSYQLDDETQLTQFTYATFGLDLDYLQRKYLPYYDYDIVVSDAYSPYLKLELRYIAKDILESNVESASAELFYKQPIKLRRFGDIELAIHSGIITGDAPVDLLHIGNGTKRNGIPYETKYAFNTMPPYTFFADRYFNVFYGHRILRLYVSKYSAPRLILHQHSGWGMLSHPERHHEVNVRDYRFGYHESGLGLEQVVRYNAFGLLYIGINLSAWYRWGPYSGPAFKDNFAAKFGLAVGF